MVTDEQERKQLAESTPKDLAISFNDDVLSSFFVNPDEGTVINETLQMITYIPRTNPEEVLQKLSAQFPPEYKLTQTSLDTYGGGKVYQVQKGTETWYLNLVPAKLKAGTLVVQWSESPL